MSKFYMMVGLPGAGKTTYVSEYLLPLGIVSVCPDDIRKELQGDKPYDSSLNSLVFDMAYERVGYLLSKSENVVLDSCMIALEHRIRFSELATENGAKTIIILVDTAKSLCIKRNLQRAKPVPIGIIEKYWMQFHMPSTYEYDEFWKIETN